MVSAHGESPLAGGTGTEMMKSVRAQQGFTLIELMIVVAVLSIVAALAIPNFLRYQAKSRQTEARTNLGGIFVAETSYFGEQSRYGSFGEIGYALAGTSNRYVYAATPTGGNAAAPQNCPTTDVNASCIAVGVGVNPGNDPGSTVGAVAGASTNPVGFTAAAWANLDSDSGRDRWYVNDIKQNLSIPDRDDVSG
jgi:type IV pilus assembly protein PilA